MTVDRSGLLTEMRLRDSHGLDTLATAEAVALMNTQNFVAAQAVADQHAAIVQAVELVSAALAAGGRLFYGGAGTSGRLGVLDASEIPPTFGADSALVQGIIAGGEDAMFRSQEGAEDRAADGAAAMEDRKVGPTDVVMGIAAGGTTPFVHGLLRSAAQRGAKTIFLSCVQPVADEPTVDVVIRPLTGPELLTGSTRLKAGTATKMVLNTISTLAMVRLGKVYENLMVDLRASNAKLRDRAERMVMTLTHLSREASATLLQQADGWVKLAVVMHAHQTDSGSAKAILENANGQLRVALRD